MSLFYDLAQLADVLAAESSRLAKRAAIANAIRAIVGLPSLDNTAGIAIPNRTADTIPDHALEDAGLFALYLSGQPFPEADPRKLNAGGAILTRALKEASHCTDAALTAAYRRHGDLGAAAFDLLQSAAPSTRTLTLDELANTFDIIATARTTAIRSAAVLELLRRATALEAKYLLKLMLADMRIGVKQSLIEEAIAAAASTGADNITPAAVRHAVMLEADLARSVRMAFAGTLADARMRLFHPLGFMLASPVETPEEAIDRFTPKLEKQAKKSKRKPEDSDESVEDLVELTNEPLAPHPPSKPVIPSEAEGSASPEPATISDEATASEEASAPLKGTDFSPSISSLQEDGALAPEGIRAYLEDKFDGMRAQLHCGDPTQPARVALYSRNREDITQSFPELTEAFANITTPLILDGEILGWDPATNKALPFATLGQRIGRKKVDDDIRRTIPVVFMAFDILYEGETLLLDHPLHQRRARLEALYNTVSRTTTSPLEAPTSDAPQLSIFATAQPEQAPVPRLRLSSSALIESAAAIDRAYADARARGNEGVMLKAADSHYLPGRRGLSWVKLKRTLDTLDVVITGAEYGHGRRAGLLSDYTFAIRNERAATDAPAELLNVGKAYSGVTDAEILELTEWCKAHTLEDHGHFRTVEPLRVLEVAFNNIMRSERHASGFALRFPRIIRIRDDKPVTEIDTLHRVEEIYQSQPDKPFEESPND